ncbi:MAG: hypothetical protein AB1513_08805 [Pseudomonadota bacterium]
MEKKAGVVNNGVVGNVIVVAPDITAEKLDAMGAILVPDGVPVEIGWGYDGATFRPPAVSIDEIEAGLCADIEAAYAAAIDVIAAQYPATERDSWPKQEAEARAWTADNAAATPLLSAIATARGIALADLAARVIANADAYAAQGGAIIGRRQARMDAIAAAVAANDIAALQAVTW